MQLRREGQVEERYPRIYQMEATTRLIYKGLAIILLAAAVVPILHLVGIMEPPRSPLAMALVYVPFVAIPIWMCYFADRRVILYENAIEVEGWLSTRQLRREEILGRRMGGGYRRGYRIPSYYIIVPLDKGKKELKLPPFLRMDKSFFSWMKTIPQVKK